LHILGPLLLGSLLLGSPARIETGAMMAEAGPERHEITVQPAEAGRRVDRLLAERLPELSRSRLKGLIEAGHLSADGRTIVEPARRVKTGQTFAIIVPEVAPAAPQAQAMALNVVYEDESIIVIDKPAGLVVHPAPGNPDRTLVNALIAHCGQSLQGIGGLRRPGIVHRLDKDTSGLIVAAKTERAHRSLVEQFARRSIERAYHAVVWGTPTPRDGRIEGNIGRSPRNRKKMAVLSRSGKPAVTHYRVIRPLAGGAASLVECRLETGRTHQIRVHLADRGHAVVGDRTYGRARAGRLGALGAAGRAAVQDLPRQALHAKTLGFRHPESREPVRFESEMPQDIKLLINSLETL
jgi:23S rRNA pseudouridine1911/1915/1917 synthase